MVRIVAPQEPHSPTMPVPANKKMDVFFQAALQAEVDAQDDDVDVDV
eukprot:CAMPEP_0113535776 /NCGR_PEP_ID=MMETSP0015_2-20120614/5898_1 /TAXON_ID=2838 /ORGANISM="Odontella" /LENGTH=46 /DNA_ID=CAMNT_0000435077 /DNA_START=611 /DNA_END=747 /DNA_ORIENTATION=+ /assembly_acc=CAM_ASM_000160